MGSWGLHDVERTIARLWLVDERSPTLPGLRQEDRKKAREVTALLGELERIGRRALLVDAAAGHAYPGLVAAELLSGIERVVAIESDARRAERAGVAAARLSRPLDFEARVGDVADASLLPASPDVVVALHACGAASDGVIASAIAARARWLLAVPCCYARTVAFSPVAEARAEALGLPRQAEVRRPVVQALVDAERTLRLEAAGYEVTVVAFVPKSVTAHNLLWRCRLVGERTRMREAEVRLARLRGGAPQ